MWIPNFVQASTFAPSQIANCKYLTYFRRIVVVWCGRPSGSVFQRLVSFCHPGQFDSHFRLALPKLWKSWWLFNKGTEDDIPPRSRKENRNPLFTSTVFFLFFLWIHLALSEVRWGTLGRTSLLLLSSLTQTNQLFPSTSNNSASRSNRLSTVSLNADSPLLLFCSFLTATFYISTGDL